MRKMTKVLLVICFMVMGLCSCGERNETAEIAESVIRSKTFFNEKENDGVIHVSTNVISIYRKILQKDNVKIIDHKIEFYNKERVYDVWYQDCTVEEVSIYSVRTYESFEEYKADLVLNEKIQTGKYEVYGETMSESGQYELVIKEKFKVKAVKNQEKETEEFSLKVNETDGYLRMVKWLIEEGYHIVDIDVNDCYDEWTYDITYRKAEENFAIPISDAQYVYGTRRCAVEEAEEFRSQLLEKQYEIIDESDCLKSKTYLFTYRELQQ